jgi:hypothetical protein
MLISNKCAASAAVLKGKVIAKYFCWNSAPDTKVQRDRLITMEASFARRFECAMPLTTAQGLQKSEKFKARLAEWANFNGSVNVSLTFGHLKRSVAALRTGLGSNQEGRSP